MMESIINQRLNFDEMSCDEEEDNSSEATNSSNSGKCQRKLNKIFQLRVPATSPCCFEVGLCKFFYFLGLKSEVKFFFVKLKGDLHCLTRM